MIEANLRDPDGNFLVFGAADEAVPEAWDAGSRAGDGTFV